MTLMDANFFDVTALLFARTEKVAVGRGSHRIPAPRPLSTVLTSGSGQKVVSAENLLLWSSRFICFYPLLAIRLLPSFVFGRTITRAGFPQLVLPSLDFAVHF